MDRENGKTIEKVATMLALKKINLVGCSQITDDTLDILSQNCTELEDLILSNTSITVAGLMKLANFSSHLQSINLNNCDKIKSAEGLLQLAERSPTLQHLYLRGISIEDEDLLKVAMFCPNLQSIELTSSKLTPSGIALMTAILTSLKTLIFESYIALDEVMEIITQNCTKLEQISISSYPRITDKGGEAISRNCPHLQILRLRDAKITDRTLQSLGSNNLMLHSLDLSNCENITGDGFRYLIGCRKLRTLTLYNCGQITEKLNELTKGCPHLRNLDLYNCKIKDTVLKYLANLDLYSLNISSCDITDNGLDFLSKNFPNLRKLDISKCEKLTKKGVELAMSGGSLKNLYSLSFEIKYSREISTNLKNHLTNIGCYRVNGELISHVSLAKRALFGMVNPVVNKVGDVISNSIMEALW